MGDRFMSAKDQIPASEDPFETNFHRLSLTGVIAPIFDRADMITIASSWHSAKRW